VASVEGAVLWVLLELELDAWAVAAEFSAEIRLSKGLVVVEVDGVEKRLEDCDASELPNKTLASCICIA
jgi:hypothetical protein